ncbi:MULTISPECIES: SRPBCC family protein [unclassified Streptomyces]|uniref:SRPBCC family protein n=1 Tax=unclassified Streptomyces TaxID=2593676 RepID=UPI0006AFAD78|nr:MULTISPECIES: SRPBCC family protein [unclassified Streptomyces]KOX19404.1 cyclase [Streptomyces sp. NRRL F-6491]KOX37489.1 cyclase [Streptomyces sp. NRRL F-6492]
MAPEDRTQSKESGSGMDRLLGELGGFLSAQTGQLAEKATDKLGDVTGQLQNVADNGGSIADIGGRMLQGDSPVKAMMGHGISGLKDKVTDAASNLFGKGKGKRKSGSQKITSIVETIDVGAPLRRVYDHWAQYEDFSGFTKGVRNVSQGDETSSDWKVKVGPSTRSWKATVQEQVPDDHIIWTSDGAKGSTRGCVSFHELGPSLTRVLITVEYYPSGFFEKTGNVWRAQGRRLRLDLKHFRRHVTLTDDEPEGWRGEIRDGEVVRTHEEAMEEEQEEGQEEGQEEDGLDEEEEEGKPEEEDGEDESGEGDEEEYEDEEDEDAEPGEEYDEEDEEEDGEEDEDEEEDGEEDEDEEEDGEEDEEEEPVGRGRRGR